MGLGAGLLRGSIRRESANARPPSRWTSTRRLEAGPAPDPDHARSSSGPGGFGTLDEPFEALTVIQTAAIRHFPVILVGAQERDGLLQWLEAEVLADHRIDPEDLTGIHRTTSAAEVVEIVGRAREYLEAQAVPALRPCVCGDHGGPRHHDRGPRGYPEDLPHASGGHASAVSRVLSCGKPRGRRRPSPDAAAPASGDATTMTHRIKPQQLEHVRVGDCMHHGILSCVADAPLGEVARIMAEHRVHAVVVTDPQTSRPFGIVSDLDVASAVASGDEPSALELAATEALAISARESLDRAAQMMSEHSVSHLVVLDSASGHPIGILSTLDLAGVYAETVR